MDNSFSEKEKVTRLLDSVVGKVAAVREARRLYGQRLAPEFSGFRLLDPNEDRLSAVLKNLLDPRGNHAQGELFLSAFFAKFLPEWKADDLASACVKREFEVENRRRIDLVVMSESFFIAFENKPWANDQPLQMNDYSDHSKSAQYSQKKTTLFYLSGDGSDPSNDSINREKLNNAKGSRELIVIAYTKLIPWLQECEKNTLAPNVRHFIAEYISYIKYQFGGVTDMAEHEEIAKVCMGDPHRIEAALKIGGALPLLKLTLLEKLRDQIKCHVHSSWNVKTDFSESLDAGLRLYLEFPDSQEYVFSLAFEKAQLQNLEWGIQRKNKRPSDEVKKLSLLFQDVCKGLGLTVGYESWPCYKHFEEPFRDWKSLTAPWLRIEASDELAKNIVGKFERLHTALTDKGVVKELK